MGERRRNPVVVTQRGDATKWWLILVLVVAVLVSTGVLVVRQVLVRAEPAPLVPPAQPPVTSPAAGPAPSSVAGSETPVAGPLLPGAGSGHVFVQSAAAIYRIELTTGDVTRTSTPTLQQQQFSSFVAGPGWVMSKTVDDGSGVVVRDGQPASPLPAVFRGSGRVHRGPHGDLWFTPEEPTDGTRVVIRIDLDGRPVNDETIRLADELGVLWSDGAGYLLSQNVAGVYQHKPSGPHQMSSGELVAIGPRHLVVWDCDQRARCNAYRVDRADRRRTVLAAARQAILTLYDDLPDEASDFGGELNPAGTHAALNVPGSQTQLAVLDLATGKTSLIPGANTDTNANAQLTWTANSRWLLAITDHQLRAHDTRTRTTRTVTFTDEQLLHLTSATATGN